MSEQDNAQASAPQRPSMNSIDERKIYWKAQNPSWRTEPVISDSRQEELRELLKTEPDIEKGIYPFSSKNMKMKGYQKLTRSDIEWLLANHENGSGPVDWDDESQREREGLDLRGADLKGLDLSGLPLTRMLGGVGEKEIVKGKKVTESQREMAAVHLEGSDLHKAHLEDAELSLAYLMGAYLRDACLKKASFDTAHLEGARLYRANLKWANLRYAYLDRTTNLDSIDLDGAYVADTRWGDVNLSLVAWERVEKLGDELKAEDIKTPRKKSPREGRNEWLRTYRRAIRANRQVATILRNQGLNEEADDFDYRAQVLQRKLLYREGLWGLKGLNALKPPSIFQRIEMIISSRVLLLLDIISGYGYKPGRWVALFLIVLGVFWAIFVFTQIKASGGIAFLTSLSNLLNHTIDTQHFDLGNFIESIFGWVIEAVLIAIIVKFIMGRSGG